MSERIKLEDQTSTCELRIAHGALNCAVGVFRFYFGLHFSVWKCGDLLFFDSCLREAIHHGEHVFLCSIRVACKTQLKVCIHGGKRWTESQILDELNSN